MMRFLFIVMINISPWCTVGLYGQAPFKGEITYEIDIELSDAAAVERAAERIVLQSDGQRTRWTEHLAAGSRIVISNLEKGEEYVLIEFLGEKLAIITPKEKVMSSPEISGSSKYLNETQFGHTCAELNTGKFTYLFLPDFQIRHSILPSLAGLPVLFSMKLPSGIIYYRATSLKKSKIASSAFALPEEYRPITTQELQMLFGDVNVDE